MKKIGLLGYGTVGKGTYEIIKARRKEIATWVGEEVDIGKVLMLPHEVEASGLPKEEISTDFEEILEDPAIDLIVEVTGAKQAGFLFMKRALEAGKHVVTANKAVLSAHYQELYDAQKVSGKAFLFEAAVGGGIPVITPFKTQCVLNEIDKIHGILNGTCNYLLWDMFKNKSDYAPTLKKCQELGYAEADPTDDVGGFDTQRKLKILTSMALGADVPEEQVEVEGLQSISAKDIEELSKKGKTLKLLGTAEIDKEGYTAVVEPTVVDEMSSLGQIPEAINSVEVYGNFVGRLQFIGAGAGKDPTGNAIVNDIIDALSGRYGMVSCGELTLKNKNDVLKAPYYLRVPKETDLPPQWIEEEVEAGEEKILYTVEVSRKEVKELVEEIRKEGVAFFAKIM